MTGQQTSMPPLALSRHIHRLSLLLLLPTGIELGRRAGCINLPHHVSIAATVAFWSPICTGPTSFAPDVSTEQADMAIGALFTEFIPRDVEMVPRGLISIGNWSPRHVVQQRYRRGISSLFEYIPASLGWWLVMACHSPPLR